MFMFLGILSFLFFLIMLVVSINPKWISRGEKKYTRKQILLSAGVMFVLFCIFAINDGSNNSAAPLPPSTSAVTAPAKTPEQIAKEKADTDLKVKQAEEAKVVADKMNSDVVYFAQVKGKEILKDRFTSAELADGGIIIHFKLADNITMKMTGNGAFADSSKLLEAFKGRTDYTDISCQGTFPMKDSYGNVADSNIFILGLERATIDKITFANIDPSKDLYTLASIHRIRPELMK